MYKLASRQPPGGRVQPAPAPTHPSPRGTARRAPAVRGSKRSLRTTSLREAARREQPHQLRALAG
eukprot:4160608-Prymnesium_polylepis.1